jgi:ParB family chromosome partitioning protein
MSEKSKRMGRGLNHLITGENGTSENIKGNDGISEKSLFVSIESITINPDQPRKYFNSIEMERLVESIKLKGILEPLLVRKTETGFQLIAGQRRLIAAKTLEHKEVPVVIRDIPDSPKERLELALVENIIRDDLNPIEEAEGINRLKEELNQSLPYIAKLIGKDRTTISNSLRLLTLPDSIKDDIRFDRLSAGHGKAILSIDDKEKWEEARSIIISNAYTVREAESLARKINREAKKDVSDEKEVNQGDEAYYESLEKSFTDVIGLKVKIKYKGKGKKIEIYYNDNQQIELVMDKLGIVVS